MFDRSAKHCDRLWAGARLVTMAGPGLGLTNDGIVAARDGRIIYAGPAAGAPAFEAKERIVCEGRWITPGLIDCHTHLVHGGNRAREFEMRLEGASYEAIARAGGGILSTVTATRAATDAATSGSRSSVCGATRRPPEPGGAPGASTRMTIAAPAAFVR